jgi:hypothetical protein
MYRPWSDVAFARGKFGFFAQARAIAAVRAIHERRE